MHPSRYWARILEYRITWNYNDPEDVKLELIGYKVILFNGRKYPELENFFYPLLNDDNEIIGTQWNVKGFQLKLEKFRETDFQFHSNITSTGYKQYF